MNRRKTNHKKFSDWGASRFGIVELDVPRGGYEYIHKGRLIEETGYWDLNKRKCQKIAIKLLETEGKHTELVEAVKAAAVKYDVSLPVWQTQLLYTIRVLEVNDEFAQ